MSVRSEWVAESLVENAKSRVADPDPDNMIVSGPVFNKLRSGFSISLTKVNDKTKIFQIGTFILQFLPATIEKDIFDGRIRIHFFAESG